MIVYGVCCDVSKYQTILPVDPDDHDRFDFMCEERLNWDPLECYVFNPKKPRAKFFHLVTGLLVCDDVALDGMQDILERAGQILPIILEGEDTQLYGINILECVNALNHNESEYRESNGVKTSVKKFAFHPQRLSESSLFKIPENRSTDILVVSQRYHPEEEFVGRYEELGLTGLEFEKLWEGE